MHNNYYDEWLDIEDGVDYSKPQKIVRPTSKPQKQKGRHNYHPKSKKQDYRKEAAFKQKNQTEDI